MENLFDMQKYLRLELCSPAVCLSTQHKKLIFATVLLNLISFAGSSRYRNTERDERKGEGRG